MTTPSSFSGIGLSIVFCNPLVVDGSKIDSLTDEVSSYQHSVAADGGYISASFALDGNRVDVESWMANGIGRHIEVYSPDGSIIWEGFVNQIESTMGNVTSSIGPLVNIGNRVSVMYTPIIDIGTDPPTTGVSTETVIEENLRSQAKFGIWEKVVNTGNVFDADAEYIRDLYLKENAYPEANTSVALGSEGSIASVTVNCRGYIDWFGYVYNYDSVISTTTDEKLKDILAADPNGIFSTQYGDIKYNGVLVPEGEDTNRDAKTIIDEIISFGGGTDDRWLFAIYGGRRAYYYAASTTIDYIYSISETGQRLETIGMATVPPWDAKPGKWALLPDYLYGAGADTFDIFSDPRTFLIEQVDFTAPDQVSLSGGKTRKMSQYLAKLGLGGI